MYSLSGVAPLPPRPIGVANIGKGQFEQVLGR